jgi:hypothetical protein
MRGTPLLLAVIILIFSETGSVAMDKADLMVGMKTLPLLNNKITGNIKIAILFDPGLANSRHEAEAIKSIIDSGLDLPGDLNADGIIIPTNQMEKMAGSKIAIITSNLNAYYNAISNAAILNRVLTISTDLDCVRENKCILGIVSKPRVEIYYSKVAAENAKITFEQAFTMLVKPASY